MFSLVKQSVAGLQILFVAFGAMVLVPLLTGLNPSMALLGAGVGTLLFQLCTRRQVPIFLGSSFAFIAPIIYATQTWGLPSTMFGLFAAGFMYFIGRIAAWKSLLTAFVFAAIMFATFEVAFDVIMPKGPLEALLGF